MLESQKETLRSLSIYGVNPYNPIKFDIQDVERLEYPSFSSALACPERDIGEWPDTEELSEISIPFNNFLTPGLPLERAGNPGLRRRLIISQLWG
jgi:hypothetical protein